MPNALDNILSPAPPPEGNALDAVLNLRPPQQTPEEEDYLGRLAREGVPWDEARSRLRRIYPGVQQDDLELRFGTASRQAEMDRRMEEQRAAHANWEEGTWRWLNRRVLGPFSAFANFSEGRTYSNAIERIRNRRPEPDDFRFVAMYERQQQNEQNASFGSRALSTVASLPGMGAEFMIGGAALRGVGAAAGIGGRAAAGGAIARAAAAPPTVAARVGAGLRHGAALTPFVPSMYLPSLAQNLDAGQGPVEALARAYAYGTIQTALVGQLFSSGPGGLGDYLRHTGTALGEMQLVEFGAHVSGLQRTGGGSLGMSLRGEFGKAGEHAALSAITFAGLGIGRLRRNRLETAAESLRREGLTPPEIEAQLRMVQGRVGELIEAGEPRSRAQEILRTEYAGSEPLLQLGLSLAGKMRQKGTVAPPNPVLTAAEKALGDRVPPAEMARITETLGQLRDVDPGASRHDALRALSDLSLLPPEAGKATLAYAKSLVNQFPRQRMEYLPAQGPEPGVDRVPQPAQPPEPPKPPELTTPAPEARTLTPEQAAQNLTLVESGVLPSPVKLAAADVRRNLEAAMPAGVEVRAGNSGRLGVGFEKASGKTVLHIDNARLKKWAERGEEAVAAMVFEEAHHARHSGNKNARENSANWKRLPADVREAVTMARERDRGKSDGVLFLEYARMREQLQSQPHISEWHIQGKRHFAEQAEKAIRALEESGGVVLPGRPVPAAQPEPPPAAPEAPSKPPEAAAPPPVRAEAAPEAPPAAKPTLAQRMLQKGRQDAGARPGSPTMQAGPKPAAAEPAKAQRPPDLYSRQTRVADIEASSLPERGKTILIRRLSGESQEVISKDQGVTRQRIEQLEKEALKKLGYPGTSVDKIQAETARLEGREVLQERGATVTAGDLHNLPEGVYGREVGREQPAAPPSAAGKPIGQAELIATLESVLKGKSYVDQPPAGYKAVALTDKGAEVVGKMSAQDVHVRLEEKFHNFAERVGFPTRPDLLPPPVRAGLHQFDPRADPGAAPTKRSMVEGLAAWMERRSLGQMDGLTAEQRAAADFAESWFAAKQLTGRLDQIKALFARFTAQNPEQVFGGRVSHTGQRAAPEQTGKEAAADVAARTRDTLIDSVENELAFALRMEKAALAKGGKIGPGESPYAMLSHLQHAAKPTAGEYHERGVWGVNEQGNRETLGPSWAEITKSLKPGELPRADDFAVARHLLAEHERGTALIAEGKRVGGEEGQALIERGEAAQRLVSPEALAEARAAMAEYAKDPEFVARATAYAEGLTAGNNAMRLALASPGIHHLPAEQVAREIAERPTYIPLDRVFESGRDTMKLPGHKGEVLRGVTHRRTGSDEQVKAPSLSYAERSLATAHLVTTQLRWKALVEFADKHGLGDYLLRKPGTGEPVTAEKGFTQEQARAFKEMGFDESAIARAVEALGGSVVRFSHASWPKDGTRPSIEYRGPGGDREIIRVGNEVLYNFLTDRTLDAHDFARRLNAIAHLGFHVPGVGRVEPLIGIGKTVRTFATGFSHVFQFANAILRDPRTFLANTINRASRGEYLDALKRSYAFAWYQLTGRWTGKKSPDRLYQDFYDRRGDQLRQFAFDRDAPLAGVKPTTVGSVWGVVKDLLGFVGAGELGPRFLEYKNKARELTGLNEKQLTEQLVAADRAAAAGRPYVDPLPLGFAAEIMNAAAEVTTPFQRQGTVSKEITKVMPYFGANIAGTSKWLRNWKTNPSGAMMGLGLYLAGKLLQWLMFKDEPWWQEQSPRDRFNNFIIPVGGRLYRLNAAVGLDVPIGGALITTLDAASRNNPDLRGLIDESIESALPPGLSRSAVSLSRGRFGAAAAELAATPAGTAAHTALDLLRNESWTGSPITPRRDEGLPALDRFSRYQLPYLAEQLTGRGGTAGDVLRGARRGGLAGAATSLLPVREAHNLNRSVGEFYEQLQSLEERSLAARRAGLAFAEEDRLRGLHQVERQMQDMSRAARGARMQGNRVVEGTPPDDATVRDIRRRQVELARRVLGR